MYWWSSVMLCVWLCWFVYVCMYVCMWPKTGCLRSCCLKSPVSVIYCLLVEFNYHIRSLTTTKSLLCQVLHSEKESQNHSINGKERRVPENNYNYGKPRLVYIQCSYAMLPNAEDQHATALQTYNIATVMCFVEF